ncbi:response regulator [Synoicihabitans lomoniglobus]|uniref:Response regulator transcription factor n=1 Tax=Synoicihabitans lomoniglobus TaxID=2909285 RepID=A0AAE9ZZ70_9BACT|nr:response regulator transcription factor [Opitutaceae bacterium LMO-M01]WED65453.1 response regulator transcription factor [Opitutaceae bacterium LMO-M01]
MSLIESPPRNSRILIVDDSVLVREGIRSVIQTHNSEDRLEVCGEAGSVAEAIEQALLLKPDLILLDIRLPDGTGFSACRTILKSLPSTRVIVLTSFSNDGFVYEAITSGVTGYLMKEIDPAGLMNAIHCVLSGKSILSPDITAGVMQRLRGEEPRAGDTSLKDLSAQEFRVLARVAEGKTNKQIGDELSLSDNTVKNYLGSVFDKLQVRRRSQAAAVFIQSQNQKERGADWT